MKPLADDIRQAAHVKHALDSRHRFCLSKTLGCPCGVIGIPLCAAGGLPGEWLWMEALGSLILVGNDLNGTLPEQYVPFMVSTACSQPKTRDILYLAELPDHHDLY